MAFVSGGVEGRRYSFPFGLFSKNFVRAAHNPTAPGKRKKERKTLRAVALTEKTSKDFGKCKINTNVAGKESTTRDQIG